MNKMTEGHIVKRYDDEMLKLHQLVLDLGQLVRAQLETAVKTLQDEDPGAARKVIERDREINAMDVQAEAALVSLIAKRQPVARDLRELITVSRMVTDLERVGDEARKLAQLTVHFYDNDTSPPNHQILRDIVNMSAFVGDMLGKSLDAFDQLDLAEGVAVIRMDRELEEEFRSSLRRLSTFIMEDSRSVGQVIDVVLGLRAIERIGGHAKNIGGYVVFLVKGKDVRHEPLEAVEAEVMSDRTD
jgi:phosphate transport system protein